MTSTALVPVRPAPLATVDVVRQLDREIVEYLDLLRPLALLPEKR